MKLFYVSMISVLLMSLNVSAKGLVCKTAKSTQGFATLTQSDDGTAMVPADIGGQPAGYEFVIDHTTSNNSVAIITGHSTAGQEIACPGSCPQTTFELKVHVSPDTFDGQGNPDPNRKGLFTLTTKGFNEELGFDVESKIPIFVTCQDAK